jgi:hypothetical protein
MPLDAITRRTRRAVRLAAVALTFAATLAGGGLAATASPGQEPSCGSLAHCIANEAKYEYSNDDGHKYEKPLGTNCNFFTKKHWHAAGATHCANGWWSEEWCMDFSRWVYVQEHASVAHLNHLAYSAKDYPTYKTYASGRRPKVGDLAVWKTESHVGIVVAVSSRHATVVSGNSYNPSRGDYTAIYKKTYTAGTFQGFAAPIKS